MTLEEEHTTQAAPPAPPTATNENVRKSMQGNKRANTKPEQVVRAMLRNMGYPGYRLQWKKCPGHPDIAFPGRKIAIFVNGCFWHRCPTCNLPLPKSNLQYWQAKFARNQKRDAQTKQALQADGWTVVTIWEHELKKTVREATSSYLYEVITLPAEERQNAVEAHERNAGDTSR